MRVNICCCSINKISIKIKNCAARNFDITINFDLLINFDFFDLIALELLMVSA